MLVQYRSPHCRLYGITKSYHFTDERELSIGIFYQYHTLRDSYGALVVDNPLNFPNCVRNSQRSHTSEEFLACWSRENWGESKKSTQTGQECGKSSFLRTGTPVTQAMLKVTYDLRDVLLYKVDQSVTSKMTKHDNRVVPTFP